MEQIITFSDAMVGRLLEAFEKSEFSNNAIVVLSADHGMHMGEKTSPRKFIILYQDEMMRFY
jgi:arylsulfatase A-like enzyme